MKTLRILLVDDRPAVRDGLRGILSRCPSCQVCGEAAAGRAAIAACAELQPDLVIMDIALPDGNGLDATRHIRQAHPQTEVLILSMQESAQLVRDALAAGARGFILQSDLAKDLLAAIETLRQHKPFFNVQAKTAPQAVELTARERELLPLLAEGRSNKEAAAALHISVKTVETHRSHIMAKLNLHSISDLVRYAIRHHIIEP